MSVLSNFLADIVHILGELQAELGGNLGDSLHILHNLHAAKDDDALYLQRPVTLLSSTLIVGAEGDFIALLQRFKAVPHLTAVEIDAAVILIIEVIHGHAVGIALVTYDGENATRFTFQHRDALLVGELQLLSYQFSKHTLLRAEDAVASVTQTGHDVAPLVEVAVHCACVDVHVGMCLGVGLCPREQPPAPSA